MEHYNTPSNRIWRVRIIGCDDVLMCGTLAQCYEAYPTLATVPTGQRTSRGLYLEEIEW